MSPEDLERKVDGELYIWAEHFRAEDEKAAVLGLPKPWHPHISREYLRAEILRQEARAPKEIA